MKPPAFQFYAGDFIAGTITLSHAERGLYILALCLQWDQGGVSPDDLANLAGSTPTARVLQKFQVGEDGLLRNNRLEFEREKQVEYRKGQSNKGKASAQARFNRGSTTVQPEGQPEGQPKPNSPSPSPSPSSLVERERAFPEVPPMPRKEFDALAEMRGIPKECAEWFWNACDGRNWTDTHGQPIRKVEPLLLNAAKNWRAIESSRKQIQSGKWQKPEPTVDDILRKLL